MMQELIGKVITSITGATENSDSIIITLSNGDRYAMYHDQDCCENVSIEDIIGDVADLIGKPLTMAEESVSSENPTDISVKGYVPDSFTWTFYKFATVKGYVTIRWYGESNGYYSESVTFEKIK